MMKMKALLARRYVMLGMAAVVIVAVCGATLATLNRPSPTQGQRRVTYALTSTATESSTVVGGPSATEKQSAFEVDQPVPQTISFQLTN